MYALEYEIRKFLIEMVGMYTHTNKLSISNCIMKYVEDAFCLSDT